MKQWWLCGLLACAPPTLAAGQTADAPTPNPRAPARCMFLEEVDRTMDPVVLTAAMVACVRTGRLDDAVDLFNIAGVFAKFDALRVSDVSAHQAYPALKYLAGQALDEASAARFNEHLKTRSREPGYHESLCAFVGQLYPPSYAPTYMTRHGMGAFTGKPQAVEDFQPNAAWDQVRSQYLRCSSGPKPAS